MLWLLACPEPPAPGPVTPERVWVSFSDDGERYTAHCNSEPAVDAEPEWLVDGEDREPTGLECRTAVACSLMGFQSEAVRPDEQFELVLRAEPREDSLVCTVSCGTEADAAYALSWDGRPGALLWPQARLEENTCRAEGALTAELVVAAGPAEALLEVELHGPEGDLGFAVDAADIDGDGVVELLLGAPKAGSPTYAGQVFALSARDLGVRSVELATPLFEGGQAAEYAGWSLSASGDRLLVGSPGLGELAHRGGAVHLFEGTRAAETWPGPLTYAWAGVDVLAAEGGLLAGAYGVDEDRGAAYQLDLGGFEAELVAGSEPEDYLGLAVAEAGDLDGDGLDEWAVGAPGAGRVALVGAELSWLEGPEDSYFGWDVAGIGDFDGDGLDDLAVAAPLADAVFVGALELDLDGRAVAAHGDQDADGHAELLVGEPGTATAWVVHHDGTRVGLSREGYLGWSISSVPDLDGDGLAEVLVGQSDGEARQPAVLWMSPHH